MAKILIVDDSSFQRKLLKDEVSRLDNVNILTATNGEEALQLTLEEKPDCILTDLLMPVMDGVELIRRLRASANQTPVVVVTSNSNEKKIEELENLQIAMVVNKPYKSGELTQVIKKVIA